MSGLQLSLDWSPGAVESDGPFKCRVHSRDPLRVLMKKDCGPYMKAIELVPTHTITMCSFLRMCRAMRTSHADVVLSRRTRVV